MTSWHEHVNQALGGLSVLGATVILVFRVAIGEFVGSLTERLTRRKRLAEEDTEEVIEVKHSNSLENKLIQILETDLLRNADLLGKLNDTMSDVRDILKQQARTTEEALILAKDTRESQRWIERHFGGASQ